MVDKIEREYQVPVTPALQQAGKPASPASFKAGHGGTRAGAGRPKGSANKVTQTFRDVLLQAVSEVGDSEKVGVDGQGGLLGWLKKCAVLERKTALMLVGRILPLKISTEVREDKETMTIEEAIADLKAAGMDELLAFYLRRYPVERDEGNPLWAQMIDVSLVEGLELGDEVPPKKGDTEK